MKTRAVGYEGERRVPSPVTKVKQLIALLCTRARGSGLVVDVLKVSHSRMTSCATSTTEYALLPYVLALGLGISSYRLFLVVYLMR